MVTLSVSEARATLPELLDRVEAGEEVTITRHGKPVAVLRQPPEVRNPRAAVAYQRARELHEEMEAARSRPLPDLTDSGLGVEYGEALIAEIRAGRDSRP